jgi:hypothetical protein
MERHQPITQQAVACNPLKTLNESEIKMKVIEYKVRPVTRYIVTQYLSQDILKNKASYTCGEFANVDQANRVAASLAQTHQETSEISDEYEVFYSLYSHQYDESEYDNCGLIKVR